MIKRTLTESDKNVIYGINYLYHLIKQCGTWDAFPEEKSEEDSSRFLANISEHLVPSEYQSVVNGWASYRHTSDLTLLDRAVASILARVNQGKMVDR